MRLALADEPHRLRRWRRPGTAAALIAYVAARATDRAPRGLGRTPGGRLLVVPGELPGRRALFEVAGCHGYVGARTGSASAVAAVGSAA